MLRQVGKLLGRGGTARWSPYSGAAVHLDFINRKYYWDGAERLETDFTTFTGATFGTGADAGLIGTGTATDYDISLAWAALNITAPFIMVSVFRPKLLNGTAQLITVLEAAATPVSNRTTHTITTGNTPRHQTNVAGVNQAQQTGSALTVDTNYAIATLINTDLFRNSVNGATAGAEDVSGTLPAHSLLRLLEGSSDTFPFTGRLRHVLFFPQTGGAEISQVNLNALSTALASL